MYLLLTFSPACKWCQPACPPQPKEGSPRQTQPARSPGAPPAHASLSVRLSLSHPSPLQSFIHSFIHCLLRSLAPPPSPPFFFFFKSQESSHLGWECWSRPSAYG